MAHPMPGANDLDQIFLARSPPSPVMKVGSQRLRKAALLFVSCPVGDFRVGLEQVARVGLRARLSAGPSNAREIPDAIEIPLQPAEKVRFTAAPLSGVLPQRAGRRRAARILGVRRVEEHIVPSV